MPHNYNVTLCERSPHCTLFLSLDSKVFSMNRIWNKLIETNELYGFESNNDFIHVSTLNIYKNLLKNLNIK